jgi:hypothetical protein
VHDPDVVAFSIWRPWPSRTSFSATGSRGDGVRWRIRLHHTCIPMCVEDPPHREGAFPWWKPGSYSSFWRLAGRDFHWPPMVTVWHREPGGRDALSVCQWRWQDTTGRWHLSRSWKWHVWHWHLQFPPLQAARRRLLTRCAWCGGRSVKGDVVNFGNSWHPREAHWWQGEPDLFHQDCIGVHRAHGLCLCRVPGLLSHEGYGQCGQCGRFRPYSYQPTEADRLLAGLGVGGRPVGKLKARLEELYAQHRAAEQARREG